MDIQLEKLSLIQMLQDTNDFEIIAAIKDIFKSKKKDFWNELNIEQKQEIEHSLKDYDEGKFSDFETFLLPYKQ